MKRKDRIKKKYAGSEFFKQKKQVKEEQVSKEKSESFYYKHYKPLMIIPFLILSLAIIGILVTYVQTGDFINKGISLKGGISIQVPTKTLQAMTLENQLRNEFPTNEIVVRTIENAGEQIALSIEANILPEEGEAVDNFKQKISDFTQIQIKDMSTQTISSSLGDAFFRQTMVAVLIAFIFMGLVVFLYFKTFVPSAAVILSALSDIIVTVAIVDILNIKIGTAGIAALLMLIGYSVDTDILLTTRVLKNKEGTIYERTINALKTGMTMSLTTLAAVVITFIVAESEVLKEIMIIIMIGLLIDIINTWLQNAGILRYYIEHKKQKEEYNE